MTASGTLTCLANYDTTYATILCVLAGRVLGVRPVHCCGGTGYNVGCYGFCSTQEIAVHTKGTPSALRHLRWELALQCALFSVKRAYLVRMLVQIKYTGSVCSDSVSDTAQSGQFTE